MVKQIKRKRPVGIDHYSETSMAKLMKHLFAHAWLTWGIATLAIGQPSSKGDWTQWRGPDRSNISDETGLLQVWPEGGPPLAWVAKGLGQGIAAVSVAGDQLFTVGYLEDGEYLWCLDAATGQRKWVRRVGNTVRENPLMRWLSQRIPTIDQDRLYTMTALGDLRCLSTHDGQTLWSKSYPKDFHSQRPIWGYCDYPLVDGDTLICTPVGDQATVVALNKMTGQVIWQTALPNAGGLGYGATVMGNGGGIRQYVILFFKQLVGISAEDGNVLWQFQEIPGRIASSYTPIVKDDFVFSANGYGRGMFLLQLIKKDGGLAAEERYRAKFNFNPFQDSTVLFEDHIYTFRGPNAPACINMMSGEMIWDYIPDQNRGRAALTLADRRLYVRWSEGRVALVEPTPEGYREKGHFQIPDPQEASGVTFPVVARQRLYLRDNERLLCYLIAEDVSTGPEFSTKIFELPSPINSVEPQLDPPVGRDRAPDAVFVATPPDVVDKMLELAKVKEGDVVYDLGSGDGRIVIMAAEKYGCHALGFEIDPQLVELSRAKAASSTARDKIRIQHEDIFTRDLSGADVITVYLPSELLTRLTPQFLKLKPGTRIVSHQFALPGAKPNKTWRIQSETDGEEHRLMLWITPWQTDNQP